MYIHVWMHEGSYIHMCVIFPPYTTPANLLFPTLAENIIQKYVSMYAMYT